MMKHKHRFKVGDRVTFKNRKDCSNKYGVMDGYFFGGNNFGGTSVTIKEYFEYITKRNCYKIRVLFDKELDSGTYLMLESEFVEYDTPIEDSYTLW